MALILGNLGVLFFERERERIYPCWGLLIIGSLNILRISWQVELAIKLVKFEINLKICGPIFSLLNTIIFSV